jgi:hypothetical protein
MTWTSTPESSTISRFKYEADRKVLTVEFKSGGTYNYYDVPKAVFDGMKAAPSRGKFHAQNVKGIFRYARA